jgi:2-keto-3-deoxy-6-phosphogluconate aldolase
MTPSQIASGIRNNLKDFNSFPGSSSSSPLTISTVKGPITPVKLVSIDAINRKAAYVNVTTVTDPVTKVVTTTTITTPYSY